MPKFRCDYCEAALTHDSISVRRSHIKGRNHIRYVVDYYENVAKEENLYSSLRQQSSLSSIDKSLDQSEQLSKINQSAPGVKPRDTTRPLDFIQSIKRLPNPPSIPGLSHPPPSFYYKR